MMSENMTSPISNATIHNSSQQSKAHFPMNEIESSVSRLLTTTKKLLETLTAWSSGQVGDTQVYDEYNALEVHFADATQAFQLALLPMEDMLHLPDDLYACLKETLSKEACSVTLEQHLPSIRDAILKLLQGLKKKQILLRERFEQQQSESSPSPLLLRAQQQQLSPLNISSAIPLPSPSSSTEPRYSNYVEPTTSLPRSSLSPTDKEEDESDLEDSSTEKAMAELLVHRKLASTSSTRKSHHNIHAAAATTYDNKATNNRINTKKITFYLKMGNRVKKVRNYDQSKLMSMEAVHELFRIRFSLEEDYHQVTTIIDSDTDVEYELEDLNDIQPHCILSIQEHSKKEEENDMKSILKETIEQVLHTMQLNTDSTTSSINNQPDDRLEEEVNVLRKELSDVFKLYDDYKQETQLIIKEMTEKCVQVVKEYEAKEITKVVLDTDVRKEMRNDKERIERVSNIVVNKLEQLQDTIDQIKQDVTHKRCRPSKDQLDHCTQEATVIQEQVDHLNSEIKSFKPVWKKMWEVQLQQIVKEQKFLKDQETLVVDLKEDQKSLNQVLSSLLKISELHERKKKSGLPLYQVPPKEEGFDGMSSVIKQVATIDVNHDKRVKALQDAEISRSKGVSQRIDVFEKELNDFVGMNKLKKTGGAELIEKQRQEKHQDLIKQIYNDETNSNSPSKRSTDEKETKEKDEVSINGEVQS